MKHVFNCIVYLFIPFTFLGWYYSPEMPLNALCHKETVFLLFMFAAGAMDACKDTVVHHFAISVFRNWNKRFWNGGESWKNKYLNFNPSNPRRTIWFLNQDTHINIPVIFTDGFHLFKALHTLFICLAVSCAYSQGSVLITYLLAYGMYKWAFNACYDIILIKGNNDN